MANVKIPANAPSFNTASAAGSIVAEPDYFFLYNKPFLGLAPPMNVLVMCVAPCLVYLFSVFVIFPAIAPKSKAAVKMCASFRYWHNIFMFVFSLACFVVSFYEMYIADEFKFLSFKLKDMMPMLCNEASDNLKNWYNVFLVSKIYEWIDTAFLVWLKNEHARAILAEDKPKKKNLITADGDKKDGEQRATAVSARKTETGENSNKKKSENAELNFLHLYHHATTFWLYLMMENLPGMLKNGILLNSFVHTWMYLHYAKPLPMPFLITITQICQLAFGTWVWYLGFENCSAHKNFISTNWYDYLSPWLAAPVYLLFFIKFFVQRFILKAIFGIGGSSKKAKKE